MKIVPEAFYQSPKIQKIFVDGQNCIIYKSTKTADRDNHRLLSTHALTIVVRGGLLVHNDDDLPTQIKKGEMVLLPKGLYAITDLIPDNEVFEAFVLFFDESIIEKLQINSIEESTKEIEPQPKVFHQNKQLIDYLTAFRKLYDVISAPPEMCELKLIETLNYILELDEGEVFRRALAELSIKPKKNLSRFMELHFDKPLDVEQYARLAGVSVATFRRKFHQEFNTSPKKWLIQKRLSKAQEILKQNEVPVNQVALAAGYTDIPHFIKSFEQHFSISPKKFAQSFA